MFSPLSLELESIGVFSEFVSDNLIKVKEFEKSPHIFPIL